MNKRAKNNALIIVFLLVALSLYALITFSTPASVNERGFSRTVRNQTPDTTVCLNDLTRFDWDAVYTFSPYTPKAEICKIMGVNANDCKAFLETVNESMEQLIFTKNNEVVCVVLGYSDKLGYTFDFGTTDYDYLVFYSSENPQFFVEKNNSKQLTLTYVSENETKE